MEFPSFDPYREVDITRHNLPHWEQQGATYFITFRTADSLPRSLFEQWIEERNGWLKRHHIDPADRGWHSRLERLDPNLRTEFHKTFSRQFHRYLDAGHGECVLKRPQLAEVMAQSLLHFDGDRYRMGDFVVMPNHVHLLVRFIRGARLKEQCYSWKKYSAGQINRALGRRGHFWQGESYDHIVRDADEFQHYQEYIAENPRKAKLREGQYLHYRAR